MGNSVGIQAVGRASAKAPSRGDRGVLEEMRGVQSGCSGATEADSSRKEQMQPGANVDVSLGFVLRKPLEEYKQGNSHLTSTSVCCRPGHRDRKYGNTLTQQPVSPLGPKVA